MRPFSRSKRREGRRGWGLNLTPLVDVMFNLMIFILVTAQYTDVYSMRVDLPKAETAEQVGEKKLIVLTLTDDEKIFFETEEVLLDDLETRLQGLSERKPPPQIVLRADRESTTGILVQVMDTVQKVGLRQVSIQTEK